MAITQDISNQEVVDALREVVVQYLYYRDRADKEMYGPDDALAELEPIEDHVERMGDKVWQQRNKLGEAGFEGLKGAHFDNLCAALSCALDRIGEAKEALRKAHELM